VVQAIQKENFEIDLHIQEEMVINQLTLKKNSEIKKHLHQKKSLEHHPRMWRKKVIDRKESLDHRPRIWVKKNLEPKETSELKKSSELKRVPEITHLDRDANKSFNHS
jgi:hypothetical protein